MSPDQFLARMKRREIAPAYLFLGTEAYARDRSRRALLDAVLPPEERDNGLAHYDLGQSSLIDVVDDARALSLFASRRLIVVSNAEGALPKMKASSEEDDDGEPASASGSACLAEYLRNPTPDVVLLFQAVRFDFDGEEKKKLDRVRKFYAAIPDTVEFRRYSVDDARLEMQTLVKKAGVSVERGAQELLLEALGADVARIAVEIEKLSLFAKPGQTLSMDDVSALVPDARATTIFALVNAMGRRDRSRSLGLLDTLVRDGEYLPLALAFLSTQFRQALVSKEAGLRGPQQIQGHFTKMGVPMWPSRAEQISQTMTKFSSPQLELGLKRIFDADRDMRSTRPDDRIVMEKLILALTA